MALFSHGFYQQSSSKLMGDSKLCVLTAGDCVRLQKADVKRV